MTETALKIQAIEPENIEIRPEGGVNITTPEGDSQHLKTGPCLLGIASYLCQYFLEHQDSTTANLLQFLPNSPGSLFLHGALVSSKELGKFNGVNFQLCPKCPFVEDGCQANRAFQLVRIGLKVAEV